jgi:hypothetical protein
LEERGEGRVDGDLAALDEQIERRSARQECAPRINLIARLVLGGRFQY